MEVEGAIEKKAAAMAAAVEEEVKVGRKAAGAGDVGLKELSKKLNDFAKERDWEQYHSPRNLLLAMVRIVSLHLLSLLFLVCFTDIYLYFLQTLKSLGFSVCCLLAFSPLGLCFFR